MNVPKPILTPLAGAAAALALAACGGSASSGAATQTASSAAAPATTPASATGASVRLGRTSLGRVLVNGSARTLYEFTADHGTRSACYGACASAWPPLTTQARPHAGSGINARALGTSRRRSGALQVVYHGHPLYLFAGDGSAGETNGEGSLAFGAEWEALSATGSPAPPSAHHSSVSTPTSSGY